ncbi:PAS domain-containing protein [Acidovorax facilis]|uniref:PAS domain-containing protein n=1 Tax=Acidovorax facilis TaxID=12917 RepID=UPI003CF192DA
MPFLIVNSKDTIAIVQPDGSVLYVNPSYSNVLGYSREEPIGKASAVLRLDEGGESTFLHRVAQAIERDGRWHGELVRRRKNGEAFVSEVTIEGIKDPDGVLRVSPWRTSSFGCLRSACGPRRGQTTSLAVLAAMNSPWH